MDGLGKLTVDVAYGGDFYVFVDADELKLELGPHNEAALAATANKIIPAVNAQLKIRHPLRPDINRCYQTLYTSNKTTSGDVKQTIVAPPGGLDRSPCGTGTSARVALLHTRGELGFTLALLHEAAGDGPDVVRPLLTAAVEDLADRPGLQAWAMLGLALPKGADVPLAEHARWLHRLLDGLTTVSDPMFEVFLLGKAAMVLAGIGVPGMPLRMMPIRSWSVMARRNWPRPRWMPAI